MAARDLASRRLTWAQGLLALTLFTSSLLAALVIYLIIELPDLNTLVHREPLDPGFRAILLKHAMAVWWDFGKLLSMLTADLLLITYLDRKVWKTTLGKMTALGVAVMFLLIALFVAPVSLAALGR